MTDGNTIDCQAAADKVLDFAEFFLTLGDMKPAEMLIAIAHRDPAFTYYVEELENPIETAMDFLRIYAEWVFGQVQKVCNASWEEICVAGTGSEKYRLLKMTWAGQTLLWEEVERMLGN